MKTSALDRLNIIAEDESTKWMEKANWREENSAWLDKSAKIAIRILRELRAKKLSQKDLADNISVSPQYINKIVKGQENLSLETICKIERALNISLIEVTSFQTSQEIMIDSLYQRVGINRNDTQKIAESKIDYQKAIYYQPTKTEDNIAA
jgi:transcriptional regulator with XRE-family HTH domain